MGEVKPDPTPAPILLASVEVTGPLVGTEEIKAEIIRVFGNRSNDALCIAGHESGFVATAKSPTNNDPHRSHDRGVFQINSYWHDEVTDAEAYDARANIGHAYRISKAGTDWHQWSTRRFCGV